MKTKSINNKIKTCEMCGFSFNELANHECDPEVLRDKEMQFEKGRRSKSDALEVDEMYLKNF